MLDFRKRQSYVTSIPGNELEVIATESRLRFVLWQVDRPSLDFADRSEKEKGRTVLHQVSYHAADLPEKLKRWEKLIPILAEGGPACAKLVRELVEDELEIRGWRPGKTDWLLRHCKWMFEVLLSKEVERRIRSQDWDPVRDAWMAGMCPDTHKRVSEEVLRHREAVVAMVMEA